MPRSDVLGLDVSGPPFDRFKGVSRLSAERTAGRVPARGRHQLYVARDGRTRTSVLIKVTSKPGLVYEQNLANETETLETINRGLPESPYFPYVVEHGRLPDSRLFLVTSFFDELPLATTIGDEPAPARLVTHIRIALEVSSALAELHTLAIAHVDLNPMNILYRASAARSVIRIVDFESAYDHARHGAGLFYSPPTTPGYSAPEVAHQPPDARADIYSLGAVLYTMLAGYGPVRRAGIGPALGADATLDPELKGILRTALHDEREQRYGSATAFREALAAYLERIWPGRSW
ncbi:MAG: protein kinase [Vicinamibacterales bacterium]